MLDLVIFFKLSWAIQGFQRVRKFLIATATDAEKNHLTPTKLVDSCKQPPQLELCDLKGPQKDGSASYLPSKPSISASL